ncbi:MAG: hypothetical protein ACPG3U_03035 [Rhodothermales bacterium]
MAPSTSHILSRCCALLLLGSVWMGVLAPGVVAMSRTDIQQVAGQEGLASEVQEFLNGVLEDALLRAAMAAPSQQTQSQDLRVFKERLPLTLADHGVLEAEADLSGSAHEALLSTGSVPTNASSDAFGIHQTRAP